jgi:PEGA domain
VESFWRFVDEESMFLAMREPPVVGRQHPFRITLQNGDPMLVGEGEIVESVTDGRGSFERNGMRMRFLRIDDESRAVLRDLLARKLKGGPGPRPSTSPARPLPGMPPPHRTPGAELTLPANPFSELPAAALEHFVECVLYEDTGAFATAVLATAPPPDPVPEPARAPAPRRATTPLPVAARAASVNAMPPGWESDEAPAEADDEYEPEPKYKLWKVLTLASAITLAIGLGLGWVLWGGRTPGKPLTPRDEPKQAAVVVPPPAPTPAPAAPPAPKPSPTPAAAPAAATGEGCVAKITTNPPGARATMGPVQLGVTPLPEAHLPCIGTLVLDRARYERVEQQVALEPGRPGAIDVPLSRPTALLTVSSTPPGAVVSVNGLVVGKSPVSLKVPGYTVASVAVAMGGYKPWQKKVYVKERKHAVSAPLVEVAKPKPKGSGKKL